jgi:LDH2 family malate/lactate/ureidoglycolate dehydrogenase
MAVRLSLAEVHSLATRTLAVAGMHEAARVAMADTITAAERDGCKSHGLFRLPHIVDGIRLGKVNTSSTPVVHDTAPSAVLVT